MPRVMCPSELALDKCIIVNALNEPKVNCAGAFLFHVSPFDPAVMALTALAVVVLALAASALPAFRAASVYPMQALREQ